MGYRPKHLIDSSEKTGRRKQFLARLLVLCMVFTMIPGVAFAAGEATNTGANPTKGNVTVKIEGQGTVNLTYMVASDASKEYIANKINDGYTISNCTSVKVVATAASGYRLASIESNGSTAIANGEVYGINGDTTITVTFARRSSSSSGGSSSGGGSSRPSSGTNRPSSGTTTNSDGSVTTTVTDSRTGTVTETTKEKDGTTTVVETKKDGTVTETVKQPDGTTGTVVTDSRGDVTEASATVSSSAAQEAKQKGEAVTLPVEVPAASSSSSAPTVSISVPASAGEVKVEIPVERVTPGTVVVLVDADGNETIVTKSIVTEDGVALKVSGNVTVKVIDNSKSFKDATYAQDAIAYVSSHGLFNGTSSDSFSPTAPMTRQMLMTVLARHDGRDTSGSPYAKGMAWAVEKGISDGKNPEGKISRQQLATMLYRYAGSPDVTMSGAANKFSDAGTMASYAQQSMEWAVQNGIIGGTANGTLNPEGAASRAQVAMIIYRASDILAG